jgi:hypothetical protein
MASTTTGTILAVEIRLLANDNDVSPYRHPDDQLVIWINEAVNKVTELRPDARYATDGTLLTIVPITDITGTITIDDKWKDRIVDYAVSRCLERVGGQTFNAAKAKYHLDRFITMIKV